ncbi:MAG: hypothetical protein M1820_002655 [Bogoriella megaspora]|nr:MAG: hypothetical protein M1820_002655 [Bogoriella megaspora]
MSNAEASNEAGRGGMSREGDSPTARRFLRTNLRPATLILARTGERVKRNFTLRTPGLLDGRGSSYFEREPLLRRRSSILDHGGLVEKIQLRTRELTKKSYDFATSKTGIGIFKCSIAYLLGSMATFVPAIAAMLGPNHGKHMVATVTVYFHPARSAGSMHRATILAFVAVAYAAFISFTSMGVSIFFDTHELLTLGHIIVLLVFVGGGLGFVGWLKQSFGDPLVNVACSLTSLSMITVLTKEGAVQTAKFSHDKVEQVLKMVIMGILASTAVNLIVKPIRARNELRDSFIKTTDSLGEMLVVITKAFLNGSDFEIQHPVFKDASKRYSSVLGGLPDQLRQAKYEHYMLGTEREYEIEARLVRCMQKLAHNIGALRGAATVQFKLVAQFFDTRPFATPARSSNSINTLGSIASPDPGGPGQLQSNVLPSINETPEESSENDDMLNSTATLPSVQSAIEIASSPPEMFSMFIAHLGPPMKSLAYTLKQILDDLPFGDNADEIDINSNFRSSLIDAIELFRKSRKEGLELVYRNRELTRTRSMDRAADYEEVAASCGYFSSSLEDFAEDMLVYLDILEELKIETEQHPRPRSWWWLCFWRNKKGRAEDNFAAGAGEATLSTAEQPAHLLGSVPADWDQTRRYTYRIWRALRWFRRDDVKFAIKVGVGAALYALPSFVPAWRPLYGHWRGEWGLLSYMLVCSMTIGASNTTGWQRFFGTCIGAVSVIVTWVVSNGNPFLLAFLGWLVSLGCFYIIVGQGKGPMGRFILLTYNLSALYAYSLLIQDDDHDHDDEDEGGINPEIWEIVLHRVVAVMTGCLWGIIVTRLIWPISARKKLKDGLTLLWLRMGLIWRRDPLSMILDGVPETPQQLYMDIREEFELHRFLGYLESLRKSAASEYQLRGPFPDDEMKVVLESTRHMLDAFHAMNVVIMKDLKASAGEAEVLRWTRDERNQLSLRISHLFSVLASSLKLEYPLNDAVPKIEHTRDRLLAKIFEFKKSAGPRSGVTDEDYELLYAYALVTGQLSRHIESVGQEIEGLFGVLNEDNLKLQ